jgi:Xaa-Pro dipeptidase
VDKLDFKGKPIGVEANHIRLLEIDYIKKASPGSEILAADGVFTDFRVQKDDTEIQRMHRAIKIAQQAFLNTLPSLHAGVTEKAVAAELTIQLLREGSDAELPFTPIVASGPNSANPHAVPTDRALTSGDLVVIDWGARFEGYCSDLTRTIAISGVSDRSRTIYETVKLANLAGRNAGQPGMAAGRVDDAAREVIKSAGFGEYFTHRTGHGLGMEAHETPYIFSENRQILQAGMVYTVEPGIYLPGTGGVRIEDNVVVTPSGSESLSDLSRDLMIV